MLYIRQRIFFILCSSITVNPITGKPATEEDSKKRIMYYIRGTEPKGDEPVFDEILDIPDN
jgi:hypothetical protein